MLLSRALVPTVKEAPADAGNASHALLVRGGYIRKVGAGLYDYLPLGVRVLRKIEAVVRQEMERAGAQEVLLPALLPAELLEEAGDRHGDALFRVKDRKGAELYLGPAHAEVITDLARREIRSFRELPMALYQIRSRYRDEPRPRGGLLRCRELVIKDAYSFDASEAAAQESFAAMQRAYGRILDRLGLAHRVVEADPGPGGLASAELQVVSDAGDDVFVACDRCGYAANVEVALARADGASDEALAPRAKVHTPDVGSIEAVSRFLGAPPAKFLKSLVYRAGERIVLAIVRGDDDLNETRLARALGVEEVSLATEADVTRATGAAVGFAGPVGFGGAIVIDRAAAAVKNSVTGANETDHHFTGVNLGRDFEADVADIRLATDGDACARCGDGKLTAKRGIEGGDLVLLGTKRSAAMGATFADDKQEKRPLVMGAYGLGVSRLVAAAVEQHHDDAGIRWPISIAPYQVHLVTIGKDEPVLAAARELHDELVAAGIDVLWDDRDERAGVKFKDADLLGAPLRVTLGAKALADGVVELKPRSEADPRKAERVPVAAVARVLRERLAAALGA